MAYRGRRRAGNPHIVRDGAATRFTEGDPRAAECGRKGGIASGVSRRKRKAQRIWTDAYLAAYWKRDAELAAMTPEERQADAERVAAITPEERKETNDRVAELIEGMTGYDIREGLW